MDERAPDAGASQLMTAQPTTALSVGSRGTSQSGVGLYNERLILSLIRRQRSLAKVEIARLTGLSTQTTTVIINRLEADGLLLAGEPQRGRIGQPSVPYALNPDGAFGLGLMIGRRSSDLVLMDFTAGIRARRRMIYPYPAPQEILAFAEREMPNLLAELPVAQHSRISGLGVAMPFELWNWEADLETPPGALGQWRDFDVALELTRRFARWPVRLCNDATSACAAELTFGAGASYRDFAYFYVGTFIGGGIVLNGSLFPGRSGNAGALGSMPIMRREPNGDASLQQLIRTASIYRLERRLIAAGRRGTDIWLFAGRLVELRRAARRLDLRGRRGAGAGDHLAAGGDRFRGDRDRRRVPRRRARAPCRADPCAARPHRPAGPHRRSGGGRFGRARCARDRRRGVALACGLRPGSRRAVQGLTDAQANHPRC